MKLLMAIVFFIMLWPSIIFADTNETTIKTGQAQPPIKLELPSTFDIYPRVDFNPTDWTFGIKEPRGYPQYEFKGLWRYAVKEVRNRFKRVYRRQLLSFYRESNEFQFNYNQYRAEVEEFESGGDRYGWWHGRSWIDCLSIENGGAPTHHKILYGMEGDWLELGPFVITHDLKLRIEGTGLYFDSEQPLQDLKNKYVADSEPGDPRSVAVQTERNQDWFESDYWKVKFRPSANFNIFGSEIRELVETISLKVEVQLFRQTGLHFGSVECAAQYDIQDNSFEVAAFFQLLTW